MSQCQLCINSEKRSVNPSHGFDIMQGMDAYEFAEPVEVAKQLDKAFWEWMGAAKWTERRDALQRLKAITSSPKLAPGDFADLLRELKKIVSKDSNVVCVGESIACIGNPPLNAEDEYTCKPSKS